MTSETALAAYPPSYPRDGTYADLLCWHLYVWGTRPDGSISNRGAKLWTAAEFRGAVFEGKVSDNSERKSYKDWTGGGVRCPPGEGYAPQVKRVLFGGNTEFEVWERDLDRAQKASSGKGNNRLQLVIAVAVAELTQTSAPVRPASRARWAISNIPILVPRQFYGRDDSIASLDRIRAASAHGVAALHGIAGVGKSSLAAAYAEQRRGDYQATWWIRAQSPETIESDLSALALALGWAEEGDDPKRIIDRIRNELDPILLIFDNAWEARNLSAYIPRGGHSFSIITSNSPNWRALAELVQLDCWDSEVGASYLIARTDREQEREFAVRLSRFLDGLPLAHEQAASYCEVLGIDFRTYFGRLHATPTEILGDETYAATEYHCGQTIVRTVRLALEAANLNHPAAEELFYYVIAMPSAPIPIFPLSDMFARYDPSSEQVPLDYFEKAALELQRFGLVYRETETWSSPRSGEPVVVDTLRCHGLVWSIADTWLETAKREDSMAGWFMALADAYQADATKQLPDERLTLFNRLQLHIMARNADLDMSDETARLSILVLRLQSGHAARIARTMFAQRR